MPLVSLPGGQVRDEIRETIYDTITLEPGVDPSTLGPQQFFSNVQGKTLIESNLQTNNSLPTATSYRIQGMCLDSQNQFPGNSGVIPTVLIRSSLRLTIGEKDYWKGPARFAAGRLWQNAATAVGATVLEYLHQQYGEPVVQPICFKGNHVVEIPPLQLFDVEWVIGSLTAAEIVRATPAANNPVYFVMSLKGVKRRAVQ